MPIRIDNVFYVTPSVERLSDYYSELLNVPARRAQVEAPGLMWAEVPVGGMELSFRKAEATTQVHPRDSDQFLEAKPGSGVTVSFEVKDTDAAIKHLSLRGCRVKGEPLICTGGMEVISIFEDPSGRAVQLYEPRFRSGMMAVANARASAAAMRLNGPQPSMLKIGFPEQAAIVSALGTASDDPAHQWGYVTTKEVLVGSNLRDGRNLAYSAAFYEPDLAVAKRFYGDALGLKLVYESSERLRFDVDGTVLEFRQARSDDRYADANGLLDRGRGGVAMFEVRALSAATSRMSQLNMQRIEITHPEADENGKRAAYLDIEGNVFEFWQRPDIEPLRTAMLQSDRVAAMETWDFQQVA